MLSLDWLPRHDVEASAVNSVSTARHPVSEQFASGSVEVL
jgi:hypothetical protein